MSEIRDKDIQAEEGIPLKDGHVESGDILPVQERLLRLQEQDVEQQWDSTVGLVLSAAEKDPKFLDQFRALVYKLHNSRMSGTGKESGNWMHMVLDMVSDENLGQMLDTYAHLGTLHFTEERWGKGREEYLLTEWRSLGIGLERFQGKEQRIFLLEKLLDRTQWHLEQDVTDWNPEEHAALVSAWSAILKQFRSMRVSVIRERMDQQLPDIFAIKEKLLQVEGGGINPKAIERIQATHVLFGDEYVEYGTLYQHGRGVYMLDAQPPYVRVTGTTSLNPSQTQRNVSHEFNHVRSGHQEAVRTVDADGNEQVSVPRLGIYSQAEPGTLWLNEAETEERNGRAMKIPDGEQSYLFSRQLKAVLVESLHIDQADIDRWYEVEGDDTLIRQELEEKYPNLFPTLREIEALRAQIFEAAKFSPGLHPLEYMGTKDFQKIIDLVKSKQIVA